MEFEEEKKEATDLGRGIGLGGKNQEKDDDDDATTRVRSWRICLKKLRIELEATSRPKKTSRLLWRKLVLEIYR